MKQNRNWGWLFVWALLCVECLLPITANAQAIPDSLLQFLEQSKVSDIERAKALQKIIDYHYSSFTFKDANPAIKELEATTENLDNNYFKALVLYYQGISNIEDKQYLEADSLLNSAYSIANILKHNYDNDVLRARILLAKSSGSIKNKKTSENYIYISNGLKLLEKYDEQLITAKLNSNLALLYMDIGRTQDAIQLLKKSIHAFNKIDINNFIQYLDLGNAYQTINEMDSSQRYFDSAYREARNISDRIRVLANKGINYLILNDIDKAYTCFSEAKTLTDQTKDAQLSAVSLAYLAMVHFLRCETAKAYPTIDSALAYAYQTEDLELQQFCLKTKMDIQETLGQYKEGFQTLHKLNSITDSLTIRHNESAVNQLILQHEIETYEEISEAEQLIARQRQRNIILIAITAILLTLAIFIVSIILKRRKEKQLGLELDLRNREITSKVMNQMQVNEMLQGAIKQLEDFEKDNKVYLKPIIDGLKHTVDDNTKKDFDYYFVQVHPDFYNKLLADFPHLTQNELRLCAFIKANLSTKDIATMTNISIDSVKSARKRLRKSLHMAYPSDSLSQFLWKY
ncbi:MAG: hypothetical protein J6T22_01915 [Bacteroidales bacterium]|jgi:tetratricopeptide (TPR) repeat protein|nr:hypothetical protein [Bacteroidales bacterium]